MERQLHGSSGGQHCQKLTKERWGDDGVGTQNKGGKLRKRRCSSKRDGGYQREGRVARARGTCTKRSALGMTLRYFLVFVDQSVKSLSQKTSRLESCAARFLAKPRFSSWYLVSRASNPSPVEGFQMALVFTSPYRVCSCTMTYMVSPSGTARPTTTYT